jgi:Methyltransferase domain
MYNHNYSQLISPEKYNELMSEQHKYIATSDKFILTYLFDVVDKFKMPNVLEIGPGPMRISFSILQTLWDSDTNFNFSILDIDPEFISFNKELIIEKSLPIKIIEEDINTLTVDKKIDIAISQGFHHHISSEYLSNLYSIMSEGGFYIISDEFLPDYVDEKDRKIKAIVWYSHIIANAVSGSNFELAREEAKTLLDDIADNKQVNYKSEEIINLVMENSTLIDIDERLALELLVKINQNSIETNDPKMFLSRGDYKISHEVFQKQFQKAGFKFVSKKVIGNSKGSLTVWVLQK